MKLGTRRGAGRAVAAAFAAGTLSLLAATPAAASGFATVHTGTPSTQAGRVHFWSSTDDFRVVDTKCDRRPVYAQYQVRGDVIRTLWNFRGCHTRVDYNRSFAGVQPIRYRVCVANLGPDTCGTWRLDHT